MQHGRNPIVPNVGSFVGMAAGGLKDVMFVAVPGTLAILTSKCEGDPVSADSDQSDMPFKTEAVGAIDVSCLIHRSRPFFATGCVSFATADSAGSHQELERSCNGV